MLKDAQDRVHRTLAPELLPLNRGSVSLGRYNAIRVDDDIAVRYCDMRRTELEGKTFCLTAQLSLLYLLLRVVMSRILTSKEEIALSFLTEMVK